MNSELFIWVLKALSVQMRHIEFIVFVVSHVAAFWQTDTFKLVYNSWSPVMS